MTDRPLAPSPPQVDPHGSPRAGVLAGAAAATLGIAFLVWVGVAKSDKTRSAVPHDGLTPKKAATSVDAGTRDAVEDSGLPGDKLAAIYCASCHLLPPTNAATKENWAFTLNLMGYYLGVENASFRAGYRYEEWAEMLDAARLPAKRMLAYAAFERLRRYYLDAAPDEMGARPVQNVPETELFEPLPSDYRPAQGVTTMVTIDSKRRRVVLGDAFTSSLVILDAGGRTQKTLAALGIPVDLAIRGADYIATLIGVLSTTNARLGSIVRIPAAAPHAHSGATPEVLVRNLFRPTASTFADLNGDGLDEIVSSQFGNHRGQVSVFERKAHTWEEHILRVQPGAIRSEVADLNHDGRPDIVTVFAQADESVHVFMNEGNLVFRDETVIRNISSFGSSHLQLVDMNGDGALDVVLANGDDGDLPVHTLKPFHGIRIYTNDGHARFTESFFYPMYGAYKSVAGDFDGDGKPDLAAIAFFPDWDAVKPESFVLLHQGESMQFTPMRVRGLPEGRWGCMDVGDIDGDGDLDVVLGGMYDRVGVPNDTVWNRISKGPLAVVLRNQGTRRW